MNKCAGYGLIDLITNLNLKEITGVELGCANGDTTKLLLENFPNLKLYGIDPYEKYIDWNSNNINEEIQKEGFEIMMNKIKPFEDRFHLYKNYSDDIVDNFQDNELDFIFIDGLHTYEQVLKDCRNYYSKVKQGGIFSGHDFNVIFDVNRAVLDFAKEMNINKINTTEVDVWYWIK